MIRVARAIVLFIITLSVAAASASIVIGRIGHYPSAATRADVRRYTSQCGIEPDTKLTHIHYFGIIADRTPGTRNYIRFVKKAKVSPSIVDYFVSFGAPWNPVPACYAVSQGALPLLQVNLYHQNLAAIARGGANNYIVHFADEIKNFGLPVVLSLGHEMNGNWYPWGWRHDNTYHKGAGVAPAVFVAFWHKVHQLFAQQKVYNVIWLWTVNRAVTPATTPVPWWPGKQYVNWVGIDGHFTYTNDRFSNVFGPTVADVRKVTDDPILIAESAIKPGPARPAQIANLFDTVFRTPGLLGVIYFDMTARFHWQLTDTASIKAFRNAVGPYEASATRAKGGQSQ
jgi:mannan endo-1,4-beta-mannosidase